MRPYLLILAALTFTACGTESAEVVRSSAPTPATAQLHGIRPGTYFLTMTLSPTFPHQTVDSNGTTAGCPLTSEAEVNVSQVDGVPAVAYAADPNVVLPTDFQDRTVQYTDTGDSYSEWCRGAPLWVTRTWEVIFDTQYLDGIASLSLQHPCAFDPEVCVYTVAAERL